ncbi:related to acetate regulatory DNA binding [Lecanosticta acicola]|uniref:Related to acetate regulatory DNA binding n=1 Tax=Lecanosticta acicola TaxID=111012 RepID=A0AAI9EDI1_9PEZI|nr:related to acetate regulatory DNA binding [Lecanosticta acicola]
MAGLEPDIQMGSSGLQESSDSAQRRERAAIAAQACQTCRSRKSKCDEQRPRCGLCRRLNVECVYREPLPTKKDKTMVHILDTLSRLETKFDNLAISGGSSTPETQASGGARPFVSQVSTLPGRPYRPEQDYDTQQFPIQLQQGYRHLTAPHKIVLWPSIYIHLINSGITATSDLQYVLQEGTPWFIRQEMASRSAAVPADGGLAMFPLDGRAPGAGKRPTIAFSNLDFQQIQEYCDAYFNTFNVTSPILNRETFMAETITPILQQGFKDGEAQTVLALLVLALGQVALEGVFERPISMVNGAPSGFRGGTVDRPPGLEIFNEARKRIGFISTQMTLESVQAMLLQGVYYEATARHLDFWQCTVSASMACQVLIKCQSIDWQSHYGDLVKRAYWTCLLSEDLYHLDLDLPRSGVHLLEDVVPLPYFHEGSSEVPGVFSKDARSHFQYHFLAMIALRRLISRIHEVIHESSSHQAETCSDYGGPPMTVIREMARQLESWRSLLPRPLQWQDNDRLDFPNIDPAVRRPNEPLFSPDQGSVPIGHKHNLDLVTAQLRTRFYYARFMMYRAFVYKALHFPELMTAEDRNSCGLAIKSALLWPISLAPPKNKKRLVPHLFAWTQNFMAILLILRMTTENDCLKSVCEEHVNRDELEKTIRLMLEWVRDVRQVDGIADWSWGILEPLYKSGA